MSPTSTLPARHLRPGRREQLAATAADVVADAGLEALTIRHLATAAEVSIGTVQHHFPTKDDLLLAAFEHVVGRTRERLAGVTVEGGARARTVAALAELLPLDSTRRREAGIHLAFAARAAVSTSLSEIQRTLLEEVYADIATAVGAAAPDRLPSAARRDAMLLLGVVDGLALHAVSAPGLLAPGDLTAALERAVAAVLPG